ncbi:hypothetical protein BASA81_018019 [Batrachochytrium salamandrivorans]|nr:hypothetical protein BASA81_018019 [Batrachochytrium salamandrivorans]
MFDPLLWVLHHFVTHYAGQTTQGDTDDDDGGDDHGDYFDQTFDYNPKSKKADRLLQKSRSMNRHRLLQGSDITDEIDAFSFMDSKSKNRRKGSVGKKSPSKSPPQQQSQPRSQPSTSHDSFQSDEMPLPDYVMKEKAESYNQDQDIDQYNAFIESENKYFESEYLIEKEIGTGDFGTVYLATKRSNGMKVACKSILKKPVEEYALESIPPPRCHLPNPLVDSEKQPAAQCMSPRPPTLYVAHEAVIQMYLSRPGHENPYVLRVLDYITLENEFMLIMDYLDESWMSLASYMNEKIRLDIEDARKIIREIVNGMISLKQHGVFHKDLHGMVQ